MVPVPVIITLAFKFGGPPRDRGERDFFLVARHSGLDMHRRATRPRRGRADDADQAGRICFEAFRAVATAPASLPTSPARNRGRASLRSAHPPRLLLGRRRATRPHGRRKLPRRGSTIAGVGPITIDPLAQDSGVGTVLMTDVIERARCTGVAAAIAMTTNEPLGTAPGRIPVSTQ